MKRLLPLVLTLIFSLSAKGQNVEADTADLLRMHEIVIRAHLQNDLDSWMAIEADTVISANGGKVTFPSDQIVKKHVYLTYPLPPTPVIAT